MSRMPFLISGLVMATGLAWAIHLVVAPEPWATDSALAIAIGTLVLSVIAMTALLLGRGRWTRYFAAGLVLSELLIATVAETGAWMIAATALCGLSLAGLGGPWLTGWLRQRPAAGAPGVYPIVLAIGSLTVVPLVGLAAPDGLKMPHGIAGALGVLFAWGYSRRGSWALWGLRIALPIALAAAAAASPFWGALVVLLAAAALAFVAWSKEARLAVDPLPVGLPAPRPRRG
jgi:hypothetical protein